MATVTIYPHIVKEPGAAARLESHPHTRVAVIAMDYLARGISPEEMVRHSPYLTLAEVHAAMTYYHDHRGEIDAEIAELAELKTSFTGHSQSAQKAASLLEWCNVYAGLSDQEIVDLENTILTRADLTRSVQ